MKNFEIVANQKPGIVQFSNYEEVKAALSKYVQEFSEVDYSVEGIESAERDSKELKNHRDAITKVKKEINEAYSAPYKEIEKKLDELVAMLDGPLKIAKGFIDESAKRDKKISIMNYAQQAATVLGNMADKVVSSKAFFNDKWLNKTTTMKSIQGDIDTIIAEANRDLRIIQTTGGEKPGVLLARYYETLSMEGMDEFIVNINYDDAQLVEELNGQNNVMGYKVLKISGTEDQMAFIMSQLKLMGVDVEEMEDGMPQPMLELSSPDFDSFVAFDIETTGTNGASYGDEEAKITEIGAVKIENGVVIERFDELANPGRKIVPRIARLTHISDEMVADKPPVDEVIRRFKAFAGDMILVGHNIKSSDLRYIKKAADTAGVQLDNSFLDTYILAKKFKEKNGWEKLNLGYLSGYYGFEHKDAHRAWSDAEVNAQVYFELRKAWGERN